MSIILIVVREFTCLDLKLYPFQKWRSRLGQGSQQAPYWTFALCYQNWHKNYGARCHLGCPWLFKSLVSLLTFPVYPWWNINVFSQDTWKDQEARCLNIAPLSSHICQGRLVYHSILAADIQRNNPQNKKHHNPCLCVVDFIQDLEGSIWGYIAGQGNNSYGIFGITVHEILLHPKYQVII